MILGNYAITGGNKSSRTNYRVVYCHSAWHEHQVVNEWEVSLLGGFSKGELRDSPAIGHSRESLFILPTNQHSNNSYIAPACGCKRFIQCLPCAKYHLLALYMNFLQLDEENIGGISLFHPPFCFLDFFANVAIS